MFESHLDWWQALAGGLLIGLATSLMLYFNGRVTGISGIFNGILVRDKGSDWRSFFLLGLLAGGYVYKVFDPEVFETQLLTETWTVAAAGLLVGFGTILGSGCTSGHGVCGMSRLSVRSIVATVGFIVAGMISVVFFRKIGLLL